MSIQSFKTYLESDRLDEAAEDSLAALESLDIPDESAQISESVEMPERIDEAAITVPFVISMVLSAPAIVKGLAKAFSFVWRKIKKWTGRGSDDSGEEGAAERVVEFAEKWHHSYIKAVRKVLKWGGVFRSANMEDEEHQEKAAEVVFYTILFGFAILAGVATVKSISKVIAHGGGYKYLSFSTIEGVLTSIKSKEVVDFLKELV